MKRTFLLLFAFVLTAGILAFAQHGHSGGMGSMGAGNMGGMGNAGSGHADGMGHDASTDHGPSMKGGNNGGTNQQPLKSSQISGGAFRMLEHKTGLSSTQLQDLYKSSGAKNFGQFVSAMVVSKNLGLDYNKVLAGLKTGSLGETLQSLGVSKDAAKSEIKRANKEIHDAEKSNS